MVKQPVKLHNWPIKEGQQAQLTWLSSPFSKDKKIMLYAYFRANGKTEKILVEWGTLPALAIQHYYLNGDIRKSIAPQGVVETEITIHPNTVNYSEREWSIYGTNDHDVSRSFIVSFQNKKYILPLIEVVRSILAPNRFLLYRLFETNAFPQYFHLSHETNKINIDFSTQYHLKYTQDAYLFQLVWLLSNSDLRQVFENVAYAFHRTRILKFDWLFKQAITIKAIVKPNSNGGTILRITGVKNKKIPSDEISFTHPELMKSEKSNEAKKYTYSIRKKSGDQQNDFMLDEEVEGTTDDFDLIEMDNQIHEYTKLPRITKIRRKAGKQRTLEDANTKRYFIDDSGRRSTSDVGGSKVARGIESVSLHEIQTQGELTDFITVLKVLEGHPEVETVFIAFAILPTASVRRKFTYLEDGVTKRKYALATVRLVNGRSYKILEIERENRSLSMMGLYSNANLDWDNVINRLLVELVYNNGVWLSENLNRLEFENILVTKIKHSQKNVQHRARYLLRKLLS